ncbi:MAG: HEAT repeat domain-containing protein [Gemmatimonadaceae bacterium]
MMLRHILLVATMATTGTAGAWTTMHGTVASDPVFAIATDFATQPPAAWNSDDPADSLYRAGREQLNRGDYRRAASTFERIVDRYPKSTYAGDALYWQAYSLYRIGERGELRDAVKLLEKQRKLYARAATRGDGDALLARVNGALARLGDSDAAEKISERGRTTAQQPCARGENDDERTEALNALMQMNAENAMPILKAVLAKRDACSAELREKAVFLVSQKRTSETEDLLLGVVRDDPNQEVRKKAVFWLGQVNTDRAAQALVQMLESSTTSSELREQAIFALMQQRSERGQAAVRRIAEDSKSPSELREKAVFWLGQQRSPENAQYLRGLFDRLANAPEGSNGESLRQKILFSLSQMRGEGNDEWLMQVAADSKHSIETRKQALFSAGQAGVSTAEFSTLYPRLTDRELKEQVIFVMSQKRDEAAITRLMQIAKSDPDRELRKKAIFWLGQSNDPRVKDFMLEIINGPR